jgi:acetyltransferase
MDKLFNPESILVIGVSQSKTNMGRNIVQNLIRWEYPGRIHLLGAKPGNVAGQPIHTSFDSLPDGIDLAVFLTPAQAVPELIDRCGQKGIRWLAIESGGFTELADDRRTLETKVVEAAEKWGIRFVGPNGLGVVSRAAGVVTPFMKFPLLPQPGRVSLLAQSGGVGVVYLFSLGNENLGLDKFVSMGNKLSLDECDFLDYIGRSGSSDVVCVYLEDVKRGRLFFETLQSFPGTVILQKANVSKAGAAAARSHTASLSTDDRLVEAAVRQAGALRVEDMSSMVHHAMAMTMPPVKGNRLLLLSRSGGHAVIAADFAERAGFELPELPEKLAQVATSAGRARVIRAANPLDLGDVFEFDRFAAMLEIGVKGDDYDAIALVHVFSPDIEGADSERLCATAAQLTKEVGKPIYICFLTDRHELERIKRKYGYPLFFSPEILIKSMAASRHLYQVRERIRNDRLPVSPKIEMAQISEILERARNAAAGAERGWLPADQVFAVARHAGFPIAPYEVVQSAEEAVIAARRVGYPVVMKILSPELLHKSRGGGVALNIKGEEAVREEFAALKETLERGNPNARFDGVLVQKMVKGIREVFLGARRDPSFGPVVAVGFGGVYVEVLNDISFRLCPVTVGDVEEMLSEVNLFRAFRGTLSEPAADFPFLSECVCKLSNLMVCFPEIDEVDLNPLKWFDAGSGGMFVDGRIAIRG